MVQTIPDVYTECSYDTPAVAPLDDESPALTPVVSEVDVYIVVTSEHVPQVLALKHLLQFYIPHSVQDALASLQYSAPMH